MKGSSVRLHRKLMLIECCHGKKPRYKKVVGSRDASGQIVASPASTQKGSPERNHDNSLMCLMMGEIELNGQLQNLIAMD